MTHTTSSKVTTRDGRQYRKVTCSCGQYIGTTDSAKAAVDMAIEHHNTPACPDCQHRAPHNEYTGCEYHSSDSDDALLCICMAGTPNGNDTTDRETWLFSAETFEFVGVQPTKAE